MIFNFCITDSYGSSHFGVCSAGSLEEAERFIRENEYVHLTKETLNIEHGVEDIINEQYGGLAHFTTDRG